MPNDNERPSERAMRLAAEFGQQPVTIRNLAKWWGRDPSELLDAVLTVGVRDGHKHFEEYGGQMRSPNVHLFTGGPEGKTVYLRLDAFLRSHRMVAVKK